MEEKTDGVRFYKKDDLWLFVRDESFGEENGYIVQTNKKGNIVRLSYSGFTETDILRFRMQAPNFKIDYNFELEKPATTTINYKKDDLINAAAERGEYEYLNVEIAFNALAVNAKGAWILTRFNQQNEGMSAGSNMVSPFTDNIPITELPTGKHQIEYLLLNPGQQIDNPLGKIILNINIE